MVKELTSIDIKRNILALHGIHLSDEELKYAYLFCDDKSGVVCRFKVEINIKDWRIMGVRTIE